MPVSLALRAPQDALPGAAASRIQSVMLPRRVLDGLVGEVLLLAAAARVARLHGVLRVPVPRRRVPLGFGRRLVATVGETVADAGAPRPEMSAASAALVVVTSVVADVVPLGRRRRRVTATATTLVHGVVIAVWSGEGGRLVAGGPVGLMRDAVVVGDSPPHLAVAVLVPAGSHEGSLVVVIVLVPRRGGAHASVADRRRRGHDVGRGH